MGSKLDLPGQAAGPICRQTSSRRRQTVSVREVSQAECLFCGMAAGQVPARFVYSDDEAFALLDLRQPRAGHVLVIPRRHVENVFELDEATGAAVMRVTAAVARAVRDAFSPEGLSLWQSNGAAAFQEVPHLHMHVMPRWSGDELLRIYPRHLEALPDAEMDAQAEAIRARLAGS